MALYDKCDEGPCVIRIGQAGRIRVRKYIPHYSGAGVQAHEKATLRELPKRGSHARTKTSQRNEWWSRRIVCNYLILRGSLTFLRALLRLEVRIPIR